MFLLSHNQVGWLYLRASIFTLHHFWQWYHRCLLFDCLCLWGCWGLATTSVTVTTNVAAVTGIINSDREYLDICAMVAGNGVGVEG